MINSLWYTIWLTSILHSDQMTLINYYCSSNMNRLWARCSWILSLVCVYINVDISNQPIILNPEWAMIYTYYLFVNGIIIHTIICIYVYNAWLRNIIHHMNAIIVWMSPMHYVKFQLYWKMYNGYCHIHCNTCCPIMSTYLAPKDTSIIKLDESTARRQLKSPRSLSGRSIHMTLVTEWSWSWMTYCHPLCAMSIGPPILRYSYIKIWPWKSMVKVMCVVKGQGHVWPSKFKGQGYGQGQTHWSHLRPGVQSTCLLLVPWQTDHFWLRYSKFHILLWKFKVKVMDKVKPDGHIWGLGVQSICLLFVSWQSDHFWLNYSKFYI